jgi:hypothetical protein
VVVHDEQLRDAHLDEPVRDRRGSDPVVWAEADERWALQADKRRDWSDLQEACLAEDRRRSRDLERMEVADVGQRRVVGRRATGVLERLRSGNAGERVEQHELHGVVLRLLQCKLDAACDLAPSPAGGPSSGRLA